MRVERTFGFVDLGGFTAFTDEYGDERAVEVLTRFKSAVREVASRHGVRVAKWLGDGAMFVGVSTPDLVRAMLDLERAVESSGLPLPIRGGVASGRVILFDGEDYVGGAVNLAARLCDSAHAGEVLATPECAIFAPGQASGMTSCWLHGFAHPVRVVSLTGLRPRAMRPAGAA